MTAMGIWLPLGLVYAVNTACTSRYARWFDTMRAKRARKGR